MSNYSFNPPTSKHQRDYTFWKSIAMVSGWTKVHIFDAKHIKYLQSKPGKKTIYSLYKLDMSEIRIP